MLVKCKVFTYTNDADFTEALNTWLDSLRAGPGARSYKYLSQTTLADGKVLVTVSTA